MSSHLSEPVRIRKKVQVIKENVPLERVASSYTTLKPSGGGRRVGLCPLPDHKERTPSFTVYPDGRWWCFGCNRGGDVVDLYAAVSGFGSIREAVGFMGVEFGIELPGRPASWFHKQERQKPIREGIEAAKIHLARVRLYRKFFMPIMKASTDLSEEDRAHDEQLLWESSLPIAEELVGRLMGRAEDA